MLGIATVALAALLVPFPGSLSVVVTRALATATAGAPGIDLISEVGLVVLAVATLAALVLARRLWPRRLAPAVAASVGVVVAYGVSELLKDVFSQTRPCARWTFAGECPPAGDWSFPSNHATLAFGAVLVIVIATPRRWAAWAVVALAVVVAVGRVAQGVHYVHDVAAGALLGLAIPAAFGLVLGWWGVSRRQCAVPSSGGKGG